MEKVTLILQNAPPSPKAQNALRYASELSAQGVAVCLFLMGDGVLVAKVKQKTPGGSSNVGGVLRGLMARGVSVKICANCCAARSLSRKNLVPGVRAGRMADLARWSRESDSVVTF